MSLDIPTLRSSFDLVATRAPHLTARFYELFFQRHPEARPLFSRKSLDKQQEMLTAALVAVMDHLDDAPWLASTLRAMGAKHVGYGVEDHMYSWVGGSLLATLAEVAGSDWSPKVEGAWKEAIGAIAGLMLEGATEARRGAA